MGCSRQEYRNGFAIFFARGSFRSRDRPAAPALAGGFFYHRATREVRPLSQRGLAYQGAQPRSSRYINDGPIIGHQGSRASRAARSDTSIFSDFELGGGGRARGGGKGGGGEGDAAGFQKKILLFSVILPLASLEGQGCHVTCCQGPASAWRKCGRQR